MGQFYDLLSSVNWQHQLLIVLAQIFVITVQDNVPYVITSSLTFGAKFHIAWKMRALPKSPKW